MPTRYQTQHFRDINIVLLCVMCPFLNSHRACTHDTAGVVAVVQDRSVQFSSVQSLSWVPFFATPWTAAHQASCPSPSPRACSNSCPLSQGCHPTISSPVVPFCLQSFPPSRSFSVSWFFESGGQSTGVSASASVLPVSIQDWFPLRLTGLTSLLSKGLSWVFSNTIVQKHQFYGTQPSLWSNSHIHTWLLQKP